MDALKGFIMFHRSSNKSKPWICSASRNAWNDHHSLSRENTLHFDAILRVIVFWVADSSWRIIDPSKNWMCRIAIIPVLFGENAYVVGPYAVVVARVPVFAAKFPFLVNSLLLLVTYHNREPPSAWTTCWPHADAPINSISGAPKQGVYIFCYGCCLYHYQKWLRLVWLDKSRMVLRCFKWLSGNQTCRKIFHLVPCFSHSSPIKISMSLGNFQGISLHFPGISGSKSRFPRLGRSHATLAVLIAAHLREPISIVMGGIQKRLVFVREKPI